VDIIERVEPHLGHAVTDPVRPPPEEPPLTKVQQTAILRWFLHDLPYITMLVLGLVGIVLRLPIEYWVVLIPLFAVISIVMGWSHSATRNECIDLVLRMALTWCALLVAIFLLFNGGVRGVLNANANSLAMLTLLALGTFTAGVQSKEWRISAVGGLLFLAVPGLGWLDQSPLLLAAAMVVVVIVGGLAWWVSPRATAKADSSAR
jgi:hypothetical protein